VKRRQFCSATNSIGIRCGHYALDGLDTCTFHSGKLDREAALQNKEQNRPREEQNRREALTALEYMESSDNSQDFSKAVLTSLDFAEYIADGLRTKTLPASIVLRLMDYAEGWGKPSEKVEHSNPDGAVVTEIRRTIVRAKQEETETPEETIPERTH
jgi:hypothetical protein